MLPGITGNRVQPGFTSPQVPLATHHKQARTVPEGEARSRLPILPAPAGSSVQHRAITTRSAPGGRAAVHPRNEVLVRAQIGSGGSRSNDSDGKLSESRPIPTKPPSKTARSFESQRRGPVFYIGIESEFLIQGRCGETRRNNHTDFLVTMAALHNAKVGKQFARMETFYEDDDWCPGEKDFTYWILTEENKLQTWRMKLAGDKWGVEMRSPKIGIFGNVDWTSQVRETWAFIEKHYAVSKNQLCGTHVHISMQRGLQAGSSISLGMGLQNLKRIAQCAIHFEPALEALVPADRRSNLYVNSNWIDNINFWDEKITRRKAIEMIEECENEDQVIELMSPGPQNRMFAWNFRAMRKFRTVEFRKGSASVNADEALAWAELTVLFVQAAVQVTPKSLSTIPANIRELKKFLGVDKLKYVKPLFEGKDGEESLQPVLQLYFSLAQEAQLQKKLLFDAEEQRRLAKGRQS